MTTRLIDDPGPIVGLPIDVDGLRVLCRGTGKIFVKLFSHLNMSADMVFDSDGYYRPYWACEDWCYARERAVEDILNNPDNDIEDEDDIDPDWITEVAADIRYEEVNHDAEFKEFRIVPPRGIKFALIIDTDTPTERDHPVCYLYGVQLKPFKLFNVPVPNRTWSSGSLCTGASISYGVTRAAYSTAALKDISAAMDAWMASTWNSDIADSVPDSLAHDFLRWNEEGRYVPTKTVYQELLSQRPGEKLYKCFEPIVGFACDIKQKSIIQCEDLTSLLFSMHVKQKENWQTNNVQTADRDYNIKITYNGERLT